MYYKRNLPHFQPRGYAYFVTIRLWGTIPHSISSRIKNEYEIELEKVSNINNNKLKNEKYYELQKKRLIKFDRILDSCQNSYSWLKENEIAELIKSSLHYRDGKEFKLIAYTIMPNHVHVVLFPIIKKNEDIEFHLTKIMKSIKWFTAKEANKILKRSGTFWQHESFDHVIRNEKELRRIVKYTLENSVKSKLCENIFDYE